MNQKSLAMCLIGLGIGYGLPVYGGNPPNNVNAMAAHVVAAYNSKSCTEMKSGGVKPEYHEYIRQYFIAHPEDRQAFIDKMSTPLYNKMKNCGLQ